MGSPGRRILVADLGGATACSEAWRDRLRDGWPQQPPPAIEAHLSAAAPDLQRTDVLVLTVPATFDDADVLGLLALAEEASVPVLALPEAPLPPGNCFEFGDALEIGSNAGDAVIAAAAWSLQRRQEHVRRLRDELALAQRFHGGLRGQISKMHDELQLAAMVQREFLPRELPPVHGVRFAAMWRPSNYVSGDIYDIIRLGPDHVGVFVADASGHGVPAALTTMVICRSLCTDEIAGDTQRILEPGEVLARLNADMLRRGGPTARFATAVYGLVDCRARTLTLAGAGHPPPLLLRRDGTTRPMETGGGLLGVFPGEAYDQIELELRDGDCLLLYSDGFEQAFPEAGGRTRVTQRYLDEFEALRRSDSPLRLIEQLAGRLDTQSGSLHQADDVTLRKSPSVVHASVVGMSATSNDPASTPATVSETPSTAMEPRSTMYSSSAAGGAMRSR
jgi:serine phosphatase RsbU (regulator of sigma subunit)